MMWTNRDTECVAEGIRQQGTDSNLIDSLLSSCSHGTRIQRVTAIAKSLQSWYAKKKRYWIGGETVTFAQTGQVSFPELSHIDYATVDWGQIAEWMLTRSEDRPKQ